jgi:hypothetical protein
MFPQGAADDGVCALFAAWNSFYQSPYVKLVAPMKEEVRALDCAVCALRLCGCAAAALCKACCFVCACLALTLSVAPPWKPQ